MARIPKKNITTPFFHIMVQGVNKEYIFNCEKDINKYMKLMEETKEKIDTTILAYCIMNNHAHMLFYEENVETLTKYMHRVNMLYAKYYNKKYDRVGYLFRDRYKTQPIYSERHLYACVRYIHNNPVKANMCKNPKEYKYSSYNNNKFYADTEIERKVRKLMCSEENLYKDEKCFILLEDEPNKEQVCYEILEEIIIKNNITQQDLKNNKELLKETTKKLKNDYKISFRTMEKVIGVGRETLRKMLE